MKKCRFLLAMFVAFCLAPCPADATDGMFDSNGVKIRYVTEGTGEPVVLIHGWMADSSMWGRDPSGNTKLNTAGAEGFQLIALDCRGTGGATSPTTRNSTAPKWRPTWCACSTTSRSRRPT